MRTVKNFIAVVIGALVFLFTTSLLHQSVNADNEKGRRGFYLTTTTHTGDQALTACTPGFHMASLWEILDPSDLRYETTLGFTRADSGSGPPLTRDVDSGWVRTGATAQAFAGPGNTHTPNCRAWSSANDSTGSTVRLAGGWMDPYVSTPIAPWIPETFGCDVHRRVWCVED